MTDPTRVLVPTTKLPALIQKAYELSQPQGMGYLHYTAEPLTDEEINAIIARDTGRGIGMDYVKGRAVKMRIDKVGEQYSVLLFDENMWYDHSDDQFLELLKVLD